MDIHFEIELIRSQVHQWLVNQGLNYFTSSMPEIEIDEELHSLVSTKDFGSATFIFDYDDQKYLGICNYKYKYIKYRNGVDVQGIIVSYFELCYPVIGKMDFTKCKMVWEEIKEDED